MEDRLFATLDSSTRAVSLGDGYEALVTDTVGFIRKLPHHLIASFRSTLEEAREADVLLHVIDASHPDRDSQRDVVHRVLDDLGLGARPRILVFNKIDLLSGQDLLAPETAVVLSGGPPGPLHLGARNVDPRAVAARAQGPDPGPSAADQRGVPGAVGKSAVGALRRR